MPKRPPFHTALFAARRQVDIRSVGKHPYSKIWAGAVGALCMLQAGAADTPPRTNEEQTAEASPSKSATHCLATGDGFLRARLSGALKADLNWSNEGLDCSGATRPSGGVRVRFSHAFGKSKSGDEIRLVLLFGIPGLREGRPGDNLPVNLTIIREGAGQFFGTRGDDKCLIEKISQTALAGAPLRNRTYRVSASGFCTEPARAITGTGAVLMTRFDFVGRIDYSEEDRGPDTPALAGSKQ